MTFKAAIDTFLAEFIAKFPAEKAVIMQQAKDAFTKEFATKTRSQVGDLAPDSR